MRGGRSAGCSSSTRARGSSAASRSGCCCARWARHPEAASIVYLGGVAAVGAIVAVVFIFAPSGLGPREASMYGLMLAVATPGQALGAVALNRVALTLVELLVLVIGGLLPARSGAGAARRATVDLGMHVLIDIGHSFREAFFMFWATLWALILGFGISGAVQAFVPAGRRCSGLLGRRGPREVLRATLFGAASSSCSYAASAMAKTLFQRGADFVSSMVFMFASTNLVVELGIVIWVLLGWQFALGEFVGGVIMIVLFVLLARLVLKRREIEAAREKLGRAAGTCTAPRRRGARCGHGRARLRAGRTRRATRSPTRRCCGRRWRPATSSPASSPCSCRRASGITSSSPATASGRRCRTSSSARSSRSSLRLLDRERAARGRALARRDQLRRRDELHLRRPDRAAPAPHLPALLRTAGCAEAPRSSSGR